MCVFCLEYRSYFFNKKNIPVLIYYFIFVYIIQTLYYIMIAKEAEGFECDDLSELLSTIESFHIPLPSTLNEVSLRMASTTIEEENGSNQSDGKSNSRVSTEKCVVGQITFMQNTAFVWVGWGYIGGSGSNDMQSKSMARFGPLVVAYPREYENGQLACSQLLHSDNSEESSADIDVIGLQMASRLSKKVGWPVFVACALGNAAELGMLLGGADGGTQRAAALAEKEICRRLTRRKNR